MGCWGTAAMSNRNQSTIAEPETQAPFESASPDRALDDAVREYVRTYVLWRGRRRAAEEFGVSRHTLWRFLERGHVGRALPRAVMDMAGDSVETLESATWAIPAVERVLVRLPSTKTVTPSRSLPEALEDTLRLLCAAPLATVDELSRFGRVPTSTLRDRLRRLAKMGMADSVSHHLGVLGPHPQRRHFPTEKGIEAGAMVEHGTETFLREYPVSRQWFRLLAERMDAVAVLYSVAAMIADADQQKDTVRVDHYRNGPYDMLITLSGGRSIGVIRQGATLPASNLRYRLRSMERMRYSDKPFAALVLTHADQTTRRAVRSLGDPSEHRGTFVATEGELLAGDHTGVVWQQCGGGLDHDLPVRIDADASLAGILAWMERVLDKSRSSRRDGPRPDPVSLYPSRVKAAMPEPANQLTPALLVQLTRAEKDALDLLAAWPLCTREQLAGLMGGVTLRRVNQVLRSLREHGLAREDDTRLVLTDEGLTFLARRDRAAVGLMLDRWTPELSYVNPGAYAGTALRALASQMRHHAGVTSFAATLSAGAARSTDYDLFDLLPTHRSTIGYRHDRTTYVIHPDASFTLEHKGQRRPFLLEFERRATTPKRIPQRLKSYRRYFRSGWAKRDHGGRPPSVLFVFESPDSESAFLDIADTVDEIPIVTSNAKTLAKRGILGDSWMLPPPYSLDRRPLALTYQVAQ